MSSTAPEGPIWVNSTTPRVPRDPETRAKIRQQAMKNVAATRKPKKSHSNRNYRQYPVFVGEKVNLQPANSVPAKASSRPPIITLKKEPLISTKYRLPLHKLPLFVTTETGYSTGRYLLSNPGQTSLLLGRKNQPYFSSMPMLYGNSGCLTNAANCIVIRMRYLQFPVDTTLENSVFTLYGKALKSLQLAINSAEKRIGLDVLCAAEFLALYELLGPEKDDAWVRHAAGAASLIRIRGPHGFETELEKDLFMSHLGPIITQAMLNNETCFLEQSEWRQVLSSMTKKQPTAPERSEMVISLYLIMTSIPRLFRDITNAICHEPWDNQTVSRLNELIILARQLRASLQKWRLDHYDLATQSDGYCKVLVLFYYCSIISNRLLTAICWSEDQSAELEEESQQFAHAIQNLHREAAYSNLQGALFLHQKVRVADATIDTTKEWFPNTPHTNTRESRPTPWIDPSKFQMWCSLFARKTPSCQSSES